MIRAEAGAEVELGVDAEAAADDDAEEFGAAVVNNDESGVEPSCNRALVWRCRVLPAELPLPGLAPTLPPSWIALGAAEGNAVIPVLPTLSMAAPETLSPQLGVLRRLGCPEPVRN